MERHTVALSVIVPTYRGADRIEDVIASLAAQTLDSGAFEVVVIVNGPQTGYAEVLAGIAERFPDLRLRVKFSDQQGASHARNLGLDASVGRYVTFVDDDDWLQPRFLERGLAATHDDRVVVLPLIDQVVETSELRPSPYGTQTKAADGQVVPLDTQHWILMFNACKILPREMATKYRYDEDLRSGEDLVYFSQLLGNDLLVAFTYGADAHYVRQVRDGSVSRQDTSFDFLVTQRLACIKRLAELDLSIAGQADESRMKMIRSQANSIVRWLSLNPGGRSQVIEAVEAAHVPRFPRGLFNSGQADDLAFLYSFGSAEDVDGAAVAETLLARGAVVDIISVDTSRTYPQSLRALTLAADVVDTHIQLSIPLGKHVPECITAFAFCAAHTAARRQWQKPYRRVFTNSTSAGSHAAGAIFKLGHWSAVWTAELSDSLSTAPGDTERQTSPVAWDVVTTMFRSAIDARGFEALATPTINALVEAITMIVADEVVFITSDSRASILKAWGDGRLTDLVTAKSTLRVDPVVF